MAVARNARPVSARRRGRLTAFVCATAVALCCPRTKFSTVL